MRRLALIPVAALLVAAACTPKAAEAPAVVAVDTAAAVRGIDALRSKYAELSVGGDAAAIAGQYTEDATLDLYGMPRQHGRAAIEAALKTDFAMRKYTVSQVTPLQTMVRSNEDASEIGTYHDMHDAKGVKDHEWGRYVVGLRKGADGTWRLSYLAAFPDSIKPAK
jgi:uncharacterized protein (TIGR02246 family)